MSTPWTYFTLTFAWSWTFWAGAALTSGSGLSSLFLALGGLGPAVTAIGLTALTQGRAGLRDFWVRLTDIRRMSWAWLAVIFLIPIFYTALAVSTSWLIDGRTPTLATPMHYISAPLHFAGFALFTLVYGPLPEELGWRGYALGRLQQTMNALSASLVLGCFWSLWHLPLFFIPGNLVAEIFPFGSARFWAAFGLGILAQSIILTWIYNSTRSTLAAILFHYAINLVGEFFQLPGDTKTFQFFWLSLMAIAAIVAFGPDTLSANRQKALQ